MNKEVMNMKESKDQHKECFRGRKCMGAHSGHKKLELPLAFLDKERGVFLDMLL